MQNFIYRIYFSHCNVPEIEVVICSGSSVMLIIALVVDLVAVLVVDLVVVLVVDLVVVLVVDLVAVLVVDLVVTIVLVVEVLRAGLG